jgi:hypothetical protein
MSGMLSKRICITVLQWSMLSFKKKFPTKVLLGTQTLNFLEINFLHTVHTTLKSLTLKTLSHPQKVIYCAH